MNIQLTGSNQLQIPIKLIDEKCMPYRKYSNDAGFDLKARIDKYITLFPLDRVTIPTGICLAIPNGYYGDIRPRSGISRDYGKVTVSGTIDAGYRGEVAVTVINQSSDFFNIEPYERIAQIVILPIPQVNLIQVDKLDETERGENGFGHTGRV